MLMNNLDPEVAERPQDLVVYGGTGKAARNWASFDAICRTLSVLADDETLLVQSGKPVGVFTTHPDAPRVLIANANLVPRYATWDVFRDLERRGLIMYGQMTAGSWIYIGTQGILQGTYETFGAVGRREFHGSLRGRIVLTGGLGGMGGAQPLAATMNEGICLAVEVDRARALRRTCEPCSPSRLPARSRSTTATTFAPKRVTRAWRMRSPSLASCRSTSDRCSVRGRGRSAGSRCRETSPICGVPTSSCW